MKLVLRGHHLLCLKGFQGFGYNEDFVENMTKVNSLRKLDSTTVTLTNHADDLCTHCPNLKDNLCKDNAHNEIIRKMDDEVLKKIDSQKEYNSVELFEKIDNQVFHNIKENKQLATIRDTLLAKLMNGEIDINN